MREDIFKAAQKIFGEVPKNNYFEMNTVEIGEDHVHIFVLFPSRFRVSKATGIFEGIIGSVVFQGYLEVEQELWNTAFW
ncbi:MAG: transposase [Deltaproteobacteria bacterium]|nr:transposase [Deltaproteobacteria bacterium]MBW2301781.1 transposase [Deltaproteobacteria bacterium]